MITKNMNITMPLDEFTQIGKELSDLELLINQADAVLKGPPYNTSVRQIVAETKEMLRERDQMIKMKMRPDGQ